MILSVTRKVFTVAGSGDNVARETELVSVLLELGGTETVNKQQITMEGIISLSP